MKKLVVVGVSLLAVVVMVLGSQASVVGYRVVKDSQQNLIKETINQRGLLLKSVKDFAQKVSMLRYQNVSLRSILLFITGFLFGLITWKPGSLILAVWYVIIYLVIVISIYEERGLIWGEFIYWFLFAFVSFIANVIFYPVYCGLNLVLFEI